MPQAAEIIIPLIQMDKDPRLGAQFRIPNIPSELGSGNLTGNPMVANRPYALVQYWRDIVIR